MILLCMPCYITTLVFERTTNSTGLLMYYLLVTSFIDFCIRFFSLHVTHILLSCISQENIFLNKILKQLIYKISINLLLNMCTRRTDQTCAPERQDKLWLCSSKTGARQTSSLGPIHLKMHSLPSNTSQCRCLHYELWSKTVNLSITMSCKKQSISIRWDKNFAKNKTKQIIRLHPSWKTSLSFSNFRLAWWIYIYLHIYVENVIIMIC